MQSIFAALALTGRRSFFQAIRSRRSHLSQAHHFTHACHEVPLRRLTPKQNKFL